MKSIIKLITHPEPYQTWQARIDEANITNQPFVEKPYWLLNIETGQLYHDIYGCIGYPSEVSDKDEGMPGYIAIVGIVRPNESLEHYNPLNANFQLLAENQSKDVGTLLTMAVEMREKYGFGIQPDLLHTWYGDPDRFLTTLALRNEDLIRQGGDKNAVLVTPPVDMYETAVFDNYVRSLKSCLLPSNLRFYFGGCDILKNHLREFRKDNPAVFAIGGLVHSLLTNVTWMSTVGDNMFNVEDEEQYA
jgi:hypothetical protein